VAGVYDVSEETDVMSWSHDATPGHEGYLVGLVPRVRGDHPNLEDDAWRPLTRGDSEAAASGIYLYVVQVGCTCGWRSSRLDAPIGACWWPHLVDVSAHFAERCRTIWRAHAIATVFADREVSSTVQG